MGTVLSALPWRNISVSRQLLFTTCLPVIAGSYLVYSFGMKPFLSPLRKIPGLPYHPIFGNIREAMKGQAMEASIRWVAKYGGILRYYSMFGREAVLVADPDALRQILVTDEHKYDRPSASILPFGRSVLRLTGREHQVRRLLLNPIFSPEVIKGHVSHFEEYGRRLVRYWRCLLENEETKNEDINVQEHLYRMTFDVFGKAVLGRDFHSIEDPDFQTVMAFKALLSIDTVSFTSSIPFYKYLPTKENREKARCRQHVNQFLHTLIEEKRQLFKVKEIPTEELRRDLLGCLLLARDTESGQGLTSEEIYDELVTLIFAGYETTAMTMAWSLLTLSQHPEIQRKVRTEVTSLLPPADEPITWETLQSMKYLDCVIRECQRLYPAASTLLRIAKEDTHLGPYFIPRGTSIVCHLGTMMRSSHVWERPEDFSPERFLDGNPGLYTFLPFGTGPTKCLGHLFARTQMKVVLAQILRQFHIEAVPEGTYKRKHRVLLKAVPSIKLPVKLVE